MATLVAPSISMSSTRLEEPKMVAYIAFISLMLAGVAITLIGALSAYAVTAILGGLLTAVSGFGFAWSTVYFQLKGE